ncbi:MAG: hypothetical protein H6779_00925 [Candidatus Nomurabacteria bacterium]|nr:hypothetical protein [Candidatus Nomurabacteria bacterium]USN87993.1 MAG: hypothetical protein H6779_00925 [Candidatus Nomurabacteria bacterium]
MAITETDYIKKVPLQKIHALMTRQDMNIGYMLLMGKWADSALTCEEHPFGLDLPAYENDSCGPYKNRQVRFIPRTDADAEINTLIAHLNWTLDGSSTVSRLRVIYAECNENNPNEHSVYVEIWTNAGVLMAGGSDCDIEGGIAASNLLGIVHLLKLLYVTEIETIEIPYCIAKVHSDNFHNKYRYLI